ncbi:MAG: HAD family hydrolase [Ruminococcus flavefaciens]|nr:HAD family hydrolase [Ruminococcus flavefaciens]
MYIHKTLKYDVIFFDLDGTLTDPGLGITNSVAYALEKRNIKVSSRTTLYKFIGPPLQDSFEQFYGFSQEECMAAIEDYREYFSDKGIYENELYDGIEELLRSLKAAGKKVVLATSKPEEFAIKILKYFQIDGYFDFIAGATMDGTRSRKVDVIRYALEQLKIMDLSATIMIGDRKYDILGAVAVGIDSIGVLYGYGDYQELTVAGATYIVEKVTDILPLIK